MDISSISTQHIAVLESTHKKWTKLLNEYGIIYLYAMFGYGKTVQATYFAKRNFTDWSLISAKNEKFFEEIQVYLTTHHNPRVKTLLILDDIQELTNSQQSQLFKLLLIQIQYASKLQIMILSRAVLPKPFTPLRVNHNLIVLDKTDLLLNESQVQYLLYYCPTLSKFSKQDVSDLTKKCIKSTAGYALTVRSYLNHLCDKVQNHDSIMQLCTQDTFNYVNFILTSNLTESQHIALLHLSVFPTFSLSMATAMIGSSASKLLEHFIHTSCFITVDSHQTYTFNPLLLPCLKHLRELLDPQEQKHIYEVAASYHESHRDLEQALFFYNLANRTDKIAELVIYLSENADGCSFAKISEKYLNELSLELELQNPCILGAKAMIASYRMDSKKCKEYINKLKELAAQEKNPEIQATYIRTRIACPLDTAENFKDNLQLFTEYLTSNQLELRNIMPTGNMPSAINGGLDLLVWEKNKKLFYPILKKAVELMFGAEGIGMADACLGEIYYEQNQCARAIAYLTKALSDANFKGSIRVQYAVTAIMARLFQSDGQLDTSQEILQNIYQKATELQFLELLPNISTSLTRCALLSNNAPYYENWLKTQAINEYDTFYTTTRFNLLTKALVYTAMGRELEALHIVSLLEIYASLYHRTYFNLELQLIKAIIFYRRQESYDILLVQTVRTAQQYGLVRIFADFGIALLPLWKKIAWEEYPDISSKYILTIKKELIRMATAYPVFLKKPHSFGDLSLKELEVLRLLAEGHNNTQIATLLSISLGTAKFHVSNIMKKLGAENRTVAVAIAQKQDLL